MKQPSILAEAISTLTQITQIARPGWIVSKPVLAYKQGDGTIHFWPPGQPIVFVEVSMKARSGFICSRIEIHEDEVLMNRPGAISDILANRIEHAMIDCERFQLSKLDN